MISLKAVKRKYIVQGLLAYIPLLVSVVISSADVMPKHLIDYKVPLILILLIAPLLYSYILILKNHIELLSNEKELLNSQIVEAKEKEKVKKDSPISLDDYQFDKDIGYYRNKKTGELFCNPCLLKNIPSQLKVFDEFWRCLNCGFWYYKPGYKPKNNTPRIDGDNWVTRF